MVTKSVSQSVRFEQAHVVEIPLTLIDESDRFRLRTPPYAALDALAADIRLRGQTTPIFVRSAGAQYELISGYRRFAALQQTAAKTALARVFDLDDTKAFELALSENRERDDLTEIERADAGLKLHDSGYTTTDIARHLGCADRQASNYLRVARDASPALRAALQKRQVSLRAALELIVSLDGIPNSQHESLIAKIVSEELSGKRLTGFLRGQRTAVQDGRTVGPYVRELPNGGFAINARLDPRDPAKLAEALEAITSAIQVSKKLARSHQRREALIASLRTDSATEVDVGSSEEPASTSNRSE
jgi:ParB/RepB/Spo0J family partition protein